MWSRSLPVEETVLFFPDGINGSWVEYRGTRFVFFAQLVDDTSPRKAPCESDRKAGDGHADAVSAAAQSGSCGIGVEHLLN